MPSWLVAGGAGGCFGWVRRPRLKGGVVQDGEDMSSMYRQLEACKDSNG